VRLSFVIVSDQAAFRAAVSGFRTVSAFCSRPDVQAYRQVQAHRQVQATTSRVSQQYVLTTPPPVT
jgi:hypothetical protein